MGVLPPLRARPVRNLETIRSLIVVAAALLDAEVRGRAFTLEQLLKKMRRTAAAGPDAGGRRRAGRPAGSQPIVSPPCGTAGGGSAASRAYRS